MTEAESIIGISTELKSFKELSALRFDAMQESIVQQSRSIENLSTAVAESQRPRGINWTAISVCLGAIGMICAFAFVWLKTNLQPLEMNVAANDKRIETVRNECVREHQWNWDGHKQRIDTISKNDERQEQLIRLLLGERMEAYEKRINAR